MSELEPPPAELQELFDADRAEPAASPATRASVRTRVAASVVTTAAGHAAAAAGAAGALGGAGKALAVVALAVAAGAGTVAMVRHQGRHHAARSVVSRAARPPVRPPDAPAHAPPATPAPASNTALAPPAASPAAPVVHAPAAPPPAEADLLKDAWRALSSGDPARALALARKDGALHPEGVLAEEREALEVTALARLHRSDEARAAAARFLAHYPNSIHRALVEHALARETP